MISRHRRESWVPIIRPWNPTPRRPVYLALTTELVQTVLDGDLNGGLGYLYNNRSTERHRLPQLPSDRTAALEFFTAASPVSSLTLLRSGRKSW